MMLTFPYSATWAELALLPHMADGHSWDESMIDEDTPDLATQVADYNGEVADELQSYLALIGYKITADGVNVRSEQALKTAHTLFMQIYHEYDEPDCPRIRTIRFGHTWHSTPTWAMFNLGGDDDVDYSGGQPSCLTDALLANLKDS